MKLLAQALREWLRGNVEDDVEGDEYSLGDIAKRLAAEIENTRRTNEAARTYIWSVRATFDRFRTAAASIESALRDSKVQIVRGNFENGTGQFEEKLSRLPMTRHFPGRYTLTGGLLISSEPPHMVISIGVSGDSRGTGRLGYMIEVFGDPNIRTGFRVALLGTPTKERAISELVADLRRALPGALEMLASNHRSGPTPKSDLIEDRSGSNIPPGW